MSAYEAAGRPWSLLEPGSQAGEASALPGAGGGQEAAALAASFTGKGREFLKLCLRAGLLTVITLGLYRFWFLTDVRRFLWRHSRVGADGLEYRGTGRELLLGFLFALAILAPLYLGYFLLGIEAERYKAYASTPFFLVLVLFGVYASYRARRYRLTRTVFRGARFWMTGSGLVYLALYIGWALLTLVSLGLTYPWMAASLERYKMRNTFYGDLQGGFAASGSSFFKRGILLWILTVPAGLALLMWMAMQVEPGPGGAHDDNSIGQLSLIGGLALLWSPVALVLVCVMKGIEWRWWVEGLRFGPAHVTSTLGAWFLFKEYAKYGLAMIAALTVIGGALAAAFALIGFDDRMLRGPTPVDLVGLLHLPTMLYVVFALTLVDYLALFIVMGAIYRRFMLFGVWRKVMASLTLHEAQVFDHVSVKGTPSGVVGEALADALDFGF
ncbi:Uncharacterized membrane protein YjgN, DUF898 family [Rhizobiales bacterium GAS191]|nr:Uncharacterized membrane protein YjgN, DUF898 family [Rhizobiales bacterium GAS113]SEC65172.1 Uncharacterized membrane protein YjgN, DUF898 family [Rhizobiales bacterium GAS191]